MLLRPSVTKQRINSIQTGKSPVHRDSEPRTVVSLPPPSCSSELSCNWCHLPRPDLPYQSFCPLS